MQRNSLSSFSDVWMFPRFGDNRGSSTPAREWATRGMLEDGYDKLDAKIGSTSRPGRGIAELRRQTVRTICRHSSPGSRRGLARLCARQKAALRSGSVHELIFG